jgi:Helix-turn-helix domain
MGTPIEDKLALSVDETLMVLGLCRSSLYKQIKSQRLPAKKLGGRTVILMDDLRDYLRSLPAAGQWVMGPGEK